MNALYLLFVIGPFIALLLASDHISIAILTGGAVIVGCMFSFLGPTRTALLGDIVPEERIGNAMALLQVGGVGAGELHPAPVGGVLEAERARVGRQLAGGLLEGEEDAGHAQLLGAAHEELERQQRLAAARAAADQGGAAAGEAAAGDLVEAGDAGGFLRQAGSGITICRHVAPVLRGPWAHDPRP